MSSERKIFDNNLEVFNTVAQLHNGQIRFSKTSDKVDQTWNYLNYSFLPGHKEEYFKCSHNLFKQRFFYFLFSSIWKAGLSLPFIVNTSVVGA